VKLCRIDRSGPGFFETQCIVAVRGFFETQCYLDKCNRVHFFTTNCWINLRPSVRCCYKAGNSGDVSYWLLRRCFTTS